MRDDSEVVRDDMKAIGYEFAPCHDKPGSHCSRSEIRNKIYIYIKQPFNTNTKLNDTSK